MAEARIFGQYFKTANDAMAATGFMDWVFINNFNLMIIKWKILGKKSYLTVFKRS